MPSLRPSYQGGRRNPTRELTSTHHCGIKKRVNAAPCRKYAVLHTQLHKGEIPPQTQIKSNTNPARNPTRKRPEELPLTTSGDKAATRITNFQYLCSHYTNTYTQISISTPETQMIHHTVLGETIIAMFMATLAMIDHRNPSQPSVGPAWL